MKTRTFHIRVVLLLAVLLSTGRAIAQATGRVVINEYMPRTSSACGVKSEFVELLNFGPGPVNIGCYILTTGVYSVTIPPNTILQPGQFYVLGGQDVIPASCANVNGINVAVNLNWNTCNCTNTTIPTSSSSEGMMQDDGYSPLVLLDPSLKVIDAVVRGLPGAATGPVTSSGVGGGCTSKTFNIGSMNIDYEVLGMAPGTQNSYARTRDGDCVWVKETAESGGTTNNRSGRVSDISYQFDMVNPTDCGSDQGTVSIYVKHSNYAAVFPMTYTIVLDSNKDGVFGLTDQYRTDTVYNPPFIDITNLPKGTYMVTVASVKGCYLQTFGPFNIISCNPSTLPVKLVYFKQAGSSNRQHQLEWLLQEVQNLQSIVVEKSADGEVFVTEKVLVNEKDRGPKLYAASVPEQASFPYYRLKITQKNGPSLYSPVINSAMGMPAGINRVWPNPATNRLVVELAGRTNQVLPYTIFDVNGVAVGKGILPLSSGKNTGSISLPASLRTGVYQLQLHGQQLISFRFVKH